VITGAPPSHLCTHCFRHGVACVHKSDCYWKQLARLVAQQDSLPTACSPLATPLSHVSCIPSMVGDSAACLSPSTNGAFEPSWDPQHDAPGPVYDLLIGRTAYFMALSQPALLCSGTLRPLMLRATIWQLSVILSLPGLCLAMCSHAALLHLQTHLGPGLWVLLHQVQVQTRPSWQTKSFLVERERVPYYKLDIIKHLSLCCHLVTECKM
jgi:hypothetical protein